MIFTYKEIKINYEYLKSDSVNTTPILFLHGWGGSIDSFIYFARKMQKTNDCILVDFPPFGNSDNLKVDWSICDYAEMIVKLLENLGLKKVNIVAHSFGGRITIEICSKKLFKVDKILLTGCAGIKIKSFKKQIKILRYKFLKFLSSIKLYSNKKLLRFGSSDYKNLDNIMKKTFVNIVNYDQTCLLSKINCSVLLIWGRFDKETPFYFTKVFKKNIKDCGVIALNGGHFAYLEFSNLFLSVMINYFK